MRHNQCNELIYVYMKITTTVEVAVRWWALHGPNVKFTMSTVWTARAHLPFVAAWDAAAAAAFIVIIVHSNFVKSNKAVNTCKTKEE